MSKPWPMRSVPPFFAAALVAAGAVVAAGAAGAVVAAAYMLNLLKKIVWGREDKRNLADLNLREYITLAPLAVFVLWVGLFPAPFVKVMETTLVHLYMQLSKLSH